MKDLKNFIVWWWTKQADPVIAGFLLFLVFFGLGIYFIGPWTVAVLGIIAGLFVLYKISKAIVVQWEKYKAYKEYQAQEIMDRLSGNVADASQWANMHSQGTASGTSVATAQAALVSLRAKYAASKKLTP